MTPIECQSASQAHADDPHRLPDEASVKECEEKEDTRGTGYTAQHPLTRVNGTLGGSGALPCQVVALRVTARPAP
jgi:hypothetical protein